MFLKKISPSGFCANWFVLSSHLFEVIRFHSFFKKQWVIGLRIVKTVNNWTTKLSWKISMRIRKFVYSVCISPKMAQREISNYAQILSEKHLFSMLLSNSCFGSRFWGEYFSNLVPLVKLYATPFVSMW